MKINVSSLFYVDVGLSRIRVINYGFVTSRNGESIKLHESFAREVTPGLAAFANTPIMAINPLETIMAEIKKEIPRDLWHVTSVVVLITPEVKNWPNNGAEIVLAEYSDYFKRSGFLVRKDSVLILNRDDEALLTWFTLNILAGNLNRKSNTAAVIDLKRDSCDVAFALFEKQNVSTTQQKHLLALVAYNRTYEIYKRSDNKLGWDNARKLILDQGHLLKQHTYISDCMSPFIKTKWEYENVDYTVKGPSLRYNEIPNPNGVNYFNPKVNFRVCEKSVIKALEPIPKPPSVEGRPVFGFSSLHRRLLELGLNSSSHTSLPDIEDAARELCKNPNQKDPFACMDSVFIMVLLREIYGILSRENIFFAPYIKGCLVDWAFGAAFLTTQKYFWMNNDAK